jgi:ABC-type Na+ efflux pump permease subunit
MKRNFSSSLGALHPIFFMVMVYIISVAMAFFVCTTIYNSLHDTSALAEKEAQSMETLTALK